MSDSPEHNDSNGARSAGNGLMMYALWMLLAVAVVALDQVSKLAIIRWVDLYQKIEITSFLNITHQRNTGAAFSFLANAGGWQRWFFVVLASVVSAVLAVWIYRIRSSGPWVLSAGLSLVLGGAVGNLIDRIRLGYVTDFIQVLIVNWPFPSFNVADAAISVGAAFLIIDALFFAGKGEAAEATKKD